MKKKDARFAIRLKVWIENQEGELVLGMGRVVMLEAIERNGSINQAAKELKMSYRDLWGRLLETEGCLGKKLLVRRQGGSQGGGSQITPLAVTLVKQFREFQSRLQKDALELSQSLDLQFLNMRSARSGVTSPEA
jgi:molybdate transport system regulatory protein